MRLNEELYARTLAAQAGLSYAYTKDQLIQAASSGERWKLLLVKEDKALAMSELLGYLNLTWVVSNQVFKSKENERLLGFYISWIPQIRLQEELKEFQAKTK